MKDCTQIFKESVKAGRTLNVLEPDTINKVLLSVAEATIINSDFIILENKKDISEYHCRGADNAPHSRKKARLTP